MASSLQTVFVLEIDKQIPLRGLAGCWGKETKGGGAKVGRGDKREDNKLNRAIKAVKENTSAA